MVDSASHRMHLIPRRIWRNLFGNRILDLGIIMSDELKSLIEDAYDEGTLHPLFAAPVVQPDDSKDAERYRWLRGNLDNEDALTDLYHDAGASPTPEEFDAAIDAAMAAEKE